MEITPEEIKQELLKYYKKHYGGNEDRELIEFKHAPGTNNECNFYILAGSPPKGYAIYIPGHRILNLYDPHLKNIKKYKNIINN